MTLLNNELPTQHRIFIVGDFNFDQMLLKSVVKVDSLIQNFNLPQRSQYSTHIHRELLDLLFKFQAISSLPSPYSDHFVLFSNSDHYVYIEFSFQKFSFQSSLYSL